MFIPHLDQISPILDRFGSPIFITDASVIRNRVSKFLKDFGNKNIKIFYAIKSNFNPHVVKIIKDAGIYGIDAVSPNEIRLALDLGYRPEQIIFTPSNPTTEEIKWVVKHGVLQNLGSLSELKRFSVVSPKSPVSIRICPEVGGGEFEKINTGGLDTKFGITMNDVDEVKNICAEFDLTLMGVHSHIGSGFYKPESFISSVSAVCNVARQFETIEFVDFGGGFGVRYDPEKPAVDFSQFARGIQPIIETYNSDTGKNLELRIEPGKALVSESTVLATKVTTIKNKGKNTFVGIDSGFANYIRPAMYGAYQHFINISNPNGPKQRVKIAGNICETCDVFNTDIEINEAREGDILVMLVAGGYGSAMSSNYNCRPTLPEVMIDEENVTLTKKGQTYDQIIQNFI